MLRAGCGAFPVAHATYFSTLETVEAGGPGGKLPRPETAERWRKEAPRDFVFSVRCDRAVVDGRFRKTEEVRRGWERTASVAAALGARFVVFQTPAAFYPNADHLGDLYAFLRAVDRKGMLLAWEPSRGWESALVRRICSQLRLVHAVDPLLQEPLAGAVNYFRLAGGGPGRKPSRGHRYTEEELRQVAAAAGDKQTYAYFLTADMWPDANRLNRMTRQLPPRRLPPRGVGLRQGGSR
ncbi:MAG: DUF72 domain-containing protein [Elusimicrobia bacterium]|nr:DUF72 domain-containing protein [Elusimicrobiota bacterium]